MFIETHENNLTTWADYRFSDTAFEIEPTYAHTFDNGYCIEEGIVYPPEAPYTEKRAAEYPSYREYLDAQVKINSGNALLIAEGESQLATYIAACLAIKDKYPK